MILFINSAEFERLTFAVIFPGIVKKKTVEISHPETEKTLEHLDKFLRVNKVKISNLSKIIIVYGPGSFTGIRVGMALAMAFSLAAGMPLYAIKKQQLPKNLGELPAMRLKKVSADFNPASA